MTDIDDEDVDTALAVLTERQPSISGWPAGPAVRRIATSRRRRRTVAGFVAVAVIATAGISMLSTRSTHTQPVHPGRIVIGARAAGAVHLVAENTPTTVRDPADEAEVVAAQQRLTIALLQHLGDGANVSVSPLSLTLALGMLQTGARGATATQIAQALQTGGLSTAQQNAGLATIVDDLRAATEQGGSTLQSANSLWSQRGFPIKRRFLADLATYYRSGVWQTDFTTDAGANAINAWTKQQTHGKITKLFDGLDPSTVLVLANAIYFHAAWAVPFDPQGTVPGLFTTATGRSVGAKFMTGPVTDVARTSDYTAAQLAYRGGRFAALAVMPTHGSLHDFVAGMAPGDLVGIATRLGSADTLVELPRFTTTSDTDLVPTLKSLGMTDAFGNADLSGISAEPGLAVDQVRQRVYLGVGEKGTTAAAVTGVSSVLSAGLIGPAEEIVFDHPFLFLVRDTVTGAILFASEITDPTAG